MMVAGRKLGATGPSHVDVDWRGANSGITGSKSDTFSDDDIIIYLTRPTTPEL
jgi:hypothetical protein